MENMSMTVVPISSPSQIHVEQKLFLFHSPQKPQRELENLQRIKTDDQNFKSTRENLMTIRLRKVKMEKRTYEMALHVIILLSLLLFRTFF